MSASQRIAWWLLEAARLRLRTGSCVRCGATVVFVSYHPNPSFGRELWIRCLMCGDATLKLCQPHGEIRPFVPPVPWQTIEEEIAAMRAEQEAL